MIGIAILVIFVLVAIFAPFLEPYDPRAKTGPVYAHPSSAHWLGTDDGGADMLSLIIAGSRVSLIVGFVAALVAMLIGGTVGVVAGFFGSKTDNVLMRITDYMLVIPDIPLMIVIAALFGRNLWNIIWIIGIIYWTSTARLIRAQVKSVRQRVYVRRAHSLGAGNSRLIFRHVLPQVAPLLIANTVLMIALAIFAETYITFLGLGDPALISWGKLIENAFKGDAVLNNAWWAIVPPGLCVTVVILACTMVGQSMEDALNPRIRVGHLAVRRFRVRPAKGEAGQRMSEFVLEVEDLHVWFDLPNGGQLHAVQGVGFELQTGERLGLVGESGCGKTTAILAIMGLLPPTATVSGRVVFQGENILERGEESVSPHRWKDISMVFQGAMNAFNPVRRIGDQIVEPMELHQTMDGKRARRNASELLEFVGIPASRARDFPHEFSGGMRQRAAIAMALACNPAVLLADEPTTALDVMVQAQILELLTRLTDGLGLALVLVTHDLAVVSQTCHRAAVMYAGKIVETAPIETLYHDPRHPYTRLLFAATPDLIGSESVASIPGTPPRLDRELVGCSFAPRCDRAFEPCLNIEPRFKGVGSEHRAACHLNDQTTKVAT